MRWHVCLALLALCAEITLQVAAKNQFLKKCQCLCRLLSLIAWRWFRPRSGAICRLLLCELFALHTMTGWRWSPFWAASLAQLKTLSLPSSEILDEGSSESGDDAEGSDDDEEDEEGQEEEEEGEDGMGCGVYNVVLNTPPHNCISTVWTVPGALGFGLGAVCVLRWYLFIPVMRCTVVSLFSLHLS